jgi:hypothetical protein
LLYPANSKLAAPAITGKETTNIMPTCQCQGCAIAYLFSFSNQFLEASPNKQIFSQRVNEAARPAGITVNDVLVIFKLHRWHKKYMTGAGQASMFALPVQVEKVNKRERVS